MTEQEFRAILLYQTTMEVFEIMRKQQIISDEEYAAIDTMIAKKYGLDLSIIFRK